MQKALLQMNLHLHHVISDVTGVTGLAIIRHRGWRTRPAAPGQLRAIVAGECDPQRLAAFKDHRIKARVETIA